MMTVMTPAIATAAAVAAALVDEGVAPAAAAGCARVTPLALAPPAPAAGVARESSGGGALFDLASVTKPMLAVAVAWSGLDVGTPLGQLVEEARGTPSEGVTLELLLAHRAGLEAHRPLYAPLVQGGTVEPSGALRAAASARREDAPGAPTPGGFAPVYSDLGYLLAGVALARAVGARDAGEAIGRLVLEPLGLGATAGTVRDLAARGVTGPFVPTETVGWRGGPVTGAVHDENAWALTGLGGSGHAGIFATIDAVLTFGLAVLERRAELEWLVRERPGGTLRAGFDGKSADGSSAGTLVGPRAFGHLGFTGTSLWIDPDAGVVVSVLTNRVCPTRDHLAIRGARPRAHDALFARAMSLALAL